MPFTGYFSGNHTKEDKMGGACSVRGGDGNFKEGSVGKPDGKRLLEDLSRGGK